MASKYRRTSSAACIETLESRQLMSASLLHAVKHPKPIPVLTGDFAGPFQLAGSTGSILLSVDSETTKGAIAGTVVATDGGSIHYTFKGKVTNLNKVTIRAVAANGVVANLTGTTQATASSIAFKVTIVTKGHSTLRGKFTVTRQVN